jgi:hypothetical protein
MRLVLDFCRTTPLTRSSMSRFWASGISSAVTMYGPTGQKVSMALQKARRKPRAMPDDRWNELFAGLRSNDDDLVADGVAVLVVDLFEVVDVEHRVGQRAAATAGDG